MQYICRVIRQTVGQTDRQTASPTDKTDFICTNYSDSVYMCETENTFCVIGAGDAYFAHNWAQAEAPPVTCFR